MNDATKSRVEISGTFFGGTYYAAKCIKEALRCSKMSTETEIVNYYEDKAARDRAEFERLIGGGSERC